jgi:glycine/D-amino acid oxidase-like deaminating enzyme
LKHLYHATALDPAVPVKSWWVDSLPGVAGYPALSGDIETDVAIIGAGFTGLSAAYHLAHEHGIAAVVLERAHPGWGASGRNAGFCCMGSAKLPWKTMIARYGLGEARRFWRSQRASVELVDELIAREAIDADKTGRGELSLAHTAARVPGMKEDAAFMAATFGAAETFLPKEELVARGLNSPRLYGGVENAIGFGLNPWKYVNGLAAAAHRAGAAIHAGTEVVCWVREGGMHVLSTAAGRVRAKKVLIATAAYTPEDLHDDFGGRVLPALSSIVVTRPMQREELAAQGWTNTTPAYDSRHLLNYFRLLPDGRFLFGGRGGVSAAPDRLARQLAKIETAFRTYFPAWQSVEISHRWSGLVCLAADLVPHVGAWDEQPGTYFSLCYHGNGVAMGTWSGRAAARLIAGASGAGADDERAGFIRRPPPRFPLPFLRPLYLRGAYLKYGIDDALS